MIAALLSVPAAVLLAIICLVTVHELIADWYQMDRQARRWSMILATWAGLATILVIVGPLL